MKNILITSVGRRVQLTRAFVRALEKSQYRGKVITVDAGDYVPVAHFSHSHFKVPGFDSKEYVPKLLDICRKEQVGILIPLHEKEFPLLGQAREDFASNGTLLMLSSDEVLAICKDKYKTYLFFKAHGINTPHTFLSDMLGKVENLIFPLFLKPRTGMGSANTYKVNNKKELDFFLEYVGEPLIQEFVPGTEFTMDVLCDLKGNVLEVVPRVRLEVRAGEVSKSKTIKHLGLIKATCKVAACLGAIGPVTIQAIVTLKGEIKFIEINPRFGGGVPLAIEAGLDYPELISKMALGEIVEPRIAEFEDGLVMLRYDEAIYVRE